MITNIQINNFKAFRALDIQAGRLNVFTGLNGMGKSTILQALLLLRQSCHGGFEKLVLNDMVRLGTFRDVFCESAAEDRVLSFALQWQDTSELQVARTYARDLAEEKELKGEMQQGDFARHALFGEGTFRYLSAHRIKPQDTYETNMSMVKHGQLGNEGEFAPHYYHLHKNEEIPLRALAFDVEDTVFSLEAQLNSWLRVISPKVRVHTESKDGKLIQLTYSYETKTAYTANFSPKNAGFGLTYVFSVLVAILSAKAGDVLVIENPESHIHPRGQTELARLMAMAANEGVQVFCETHSDHILYGTRIAIKERDIQPEDVRVYYIDRDEEEHFSDAHPIAIDPSGRLDRASKAYFLEYENHLDKLLG